MPGFRQKVARHRGKRVRLVELTRDFVEPDWCESGHAGMVLEGELEIVFRDGEAVRFPEGSGLLIAPGPDDAHRARAITELVRLVVVEDTEE